MVEEKPVQLRRSIDGLNLISDTGSVYSCPTKNTQDLIRKIAGEQQTLASLIDDEPNKPLSDGAQRQRVRLAVEDVFARYQRKMFGKYPRSEINVMRNKSGKIVSKSMTSTD